eukprot:COSAG06_NODE_17128_length_959_cov_4.720930_2_plen_91_part_00
MGVGGGGGGGGGGVQSINIGAQTQKNATVFLVFCRRGLARCVAAHGRPKYSRTASSTTISYVKTVFIPGSFSFLLFSFFFLFFFLSCTQM